MAGVFSGGARRPPPPSRPVAPPPRRLAFGLTEANADLLWSPSAAVAVPAAFARWRAALSALRPAYLRLVLDWAQLQPSASRPPDLDGPVNGCLRGLPPCGAYAGVRGELEAIASQQRTQGGFAVVIVLDGVPAWAAAPPSGCERAGTQALSRPIAAAGLVAYRALIADLLALGRSVGVSLAYWSPWNEPNHPYFISPQRAVCRRSSPSLAPAVYAQLARAMARALAADPAPHSMLLGELAGYTRRAVHETSIAEFVADLPSDVICLARVWTVHDYVSPGTLAFPVTPVSELEAALDRRGPCGERASVWVTETGAADTRPPARTAATHAPTAPTVAAGCEALAAQLARWYADPRVTAVFQYTFREDTDFPVGLADARLTHLYPAYGLWLALATGPPGAAPSTTLCT